jgi:ubiquinone/menaquinone biosynthesis C-methylase UbiE
MKSTIQDQARELRKLLNGFQASRVILTANNLKVFDLLTVPRSAAESAQTLGTDVRATEILLDALTGLGLLKKSGGRYRNAPVAGRLLISTAPASLAGMVQHMDTLWKNWSALDEVMKTGSPARKARDNEAFIRAMHSIAFLRARDVINALDLKGVRRALDLGGGPGTYSMELAKRGISVTLFDMPETITIAKDIVQRSGGKNMEFRGGNFLNDPIGSNYDLVFISQISHSFSGKENRFIMEKSRDALNTGGRIAIQEFYIENNRTSPPPSALFSVNMLVNTDAGRCYSPQEIKGWLSDAGFGSIRHKRLQETVLVLGNK